MEDIDRNRIAILRQQYPAGCIVELVSMDDEMAPPRGTKGKVLYVDDTGTIHVAWANGSTLGVIPGIDMIRKPYEEISLK
ncbi:DUF4314 domain-containing protein [uncultured Sphaerochaeta sp.]|uniref:DUF4314 domain-containing protein n=1 Tax=uncultured Sphaerochaeta sp. TaxID=886478 RepID=UPI002A0A959B|nr:DUF4314 domain-containing protein [uncultured Sphaerochaeta sp.]